MPSFQFSVIEKDGFIRPHTDISRKIASIMIYLPENNDQRDSSLGTTFWKQKKLSGNKVFYRDINSSGKHMYEKEEYEIFTKNYGYYPIKTKFQDKYTILFFRSSTSWHSFEYDQEDLGPRISLNVNFNFPSIAK